jgi:hypothetical protein
MATVLGTRNADGSVQIERVLTPTEVKSRRGSVSEKRVTRYQQGRGRRTRSVYQARALGSGQGVLAAQDAVFTDSPQIDEYRSGFRTA